MARKKREATGWGFKLLALVLTLVAVVGVYAASISSSGGELKHIINAAIPVGSALFASAILTMIKPLRHKRWQIYLIVLILVAVFMALKIKSVI